jgi:hypothetical protein
MIKLPPCQCGALVGLILSDGWLVCSYFLLSFIPLSIGTNIEGKENKLKKLHPYYATGFADAESSFVIAVYKDTKYKTGWRVIPLFKIELHQRDLPLLKKKTIFLWCRYNSVNKRDNHVVYTVNSIKDLTNVIIPHFDKYQLITKKKEPIMNFLNKLLIFWLKRTFYG